MVLGQVGETGRRQADAVETALVDTVARRFHAQMGDAAFGEPRQILRQVAGVGRGQAGAADSRFAAVRHRGDDAQRAHAGGVMAQLGENLAAEGGDRGLAIGTGDRNADLGLGAIERLGGQGIGAADVGDLDQQAVDAAQVFTQIIVGRQHRRRALGQGLGDVVAAVIARPGQSTEQRALADLAAVGRDAGDHRVLVEVPPEKIGQASSRCLGLCGGGGGH